MSLRLRDLQQILDKFSNGNKGTAISDCFIYMATDNRQLAEGAKIDLQERRVIVKATSSADWRVVLKLDQNITNLKYQTYQHSQSPSTL